MINIIYAKPQFNSPKNLTSMFYLRWLEILFIFPRQVYKFFSKNLTETHCSLGLFFGLFSFILDICFLLYRFLVKINCTAILLLVVVTYEFCGTEKRSDVRVSRTSPLTISTGGVLGVFLSTSCSGGKSPLLHIL